MFLKPSTKGRWSEVKVTQSCLTLCDPIVHGILQARILEWVAFPFSRGSSQPRDHTRVSHIAGRFLTNLATRESWWSELKSIVPSRTDMECVSPWAALFKRERRREPGKEGLNMGQALVTWSVFISVILHSNPQRWCYYPNMTDQRLRDSDNSSMEKCHFTNE